MRFRSKLIPPLDVPNFCPQVQCFLVNFNFFLLSKLPVVNYSEVKCREFQLNVVYFPVIYISVIVPVSKFPVLKFPEGNSEVVQFLVSGKQCSPNPDS